MFYSKGSQKIRNNKEVLWEKTPQCFFQTKLNIEHTIYIIEIILSLPLILILTNNNHWYEQIECKHVLKLGLTESFNQRTIDVLERQT